MDQNKKKIIVVGQGISGTLLSWFLHKAGIDFIVIDDPQPDTPSHVAAGIINPVTGRRVVKVWLDDILLPFAKKIYREMGDFLSLTAFTKISIIDFFPNPFMKESFLKKLSQKEDYIRIIEDSSSFDSLFNFEFGAGSIEPCYIIHLQQWLSAWRSWLKKEDRLMETVFDFSGLQSASEKVQYQNIEADAIIFCDGTRGAANPYFSLLPFALNKGEAIIVEVPNLPGDFIYKKSLLLAPLAEKGIFWTGTNYLWEFDNSNPTDAFRQSTEANLKQWLKVPFKILDHKSAIRPATVERRPFAGFHPVHKNIGILNGMGTKGCSLAPYFAYQLVQNIMHQTPLMRETDIARFAGILSR